MTLDFKETGRPPTVASPVVQYPGTCSGDSVDRQNGGAPVLCAVACLLLYVRAVLTYGQALSDRIVSCPLWLYRAITKDKAAILKAYRISLFFYCVIFIHKLDIIRKE